MEVKEWSYEEMPDFTEYVEGAHVISTTGDEVGVTYIHNVEYAEINHEKLYLQILFPYTRNHPNPLCPCVVFVQGSAWLPQDVYAQIPGLTKLAERGYVVAIVQYRHSGIAPFPAQIMDAKNAVRFLRKNALKYHIDANNIFLSGDSSGGHTAMFAGIMHDETTENLYPDTSAEIKGIINYYGSTSVMADDSNPIQILHCQPDSPEGMVMGHVDLRTNPDLKKKLSVECNITSDTEVPPTLIIHGTKDRLVNCECSVILYKCLKQYKKDVQLYLLQGADHGGPEFWTQNIIDIVDQFLKEHI
ncbi:alpha/beta hydrolase fold domain-containing protein [uncultured Ruthenibacterium sp.]|uniref:alpha/beta hydrolase fold domain-containing protein n=1 Tax=uncultured Ruthenibacterium sp. TaxID=1905347 RepID=UPI00349E54F6